MLEALPYQLYAAKVVEEPSRPFEMSDRGAVGGVALAAVDEWMPVELVPHGRPHRAGPAAVDDADARQAGQGGIVDERPHRLARLLRPLPAHVELVGDVTARGGDDLDGRLRLGLALPGRAEPGERDPEPMACRSDHLRLLTLDRSDRSVDAERWRLDRIARSERPGEGQRLVERADRAFGLVRTLGRSAEPAIALAGSGGCRRATRDRAAGRS